MREIRSSGSEGGVADSGHPYPYSGEGSLLGGRSNARRMYEAVG